MDELERCRQAMHEMAAAASKAQDEERHRIARGLHDDVGQLLASARMRLDTVRHADAEGGDENVREAARLIDEAMDATRGLTFELMAPPTIERHVDAVIGSLADMLECRDGLRCVVTADPAPKPLSADVARAVFCVVRELLVNVTKHAGTGEATVGTWVEDGWLAIRVTDRGVGFEPLRGFVDRPGVGLMIVEARIGQVGGDVVVDSAPGRGTAVEVRVPLDLDEVNK